MIKRPISREDELEVAFKIWKLNESIKKIRGNSQDTKKTKSIYLTGFDSPVKSYEKVYDNMQAIKKIADWVEDLPTAELKAFNSISEIPDCSTAKVKNKPPVKDVSKISFNDFEIQKSIVVKNKEQISNVSKFE